MLLTTDSLPHECAAFVAISLPFFGGAFGVDWPCFFVPCCSPLHLAACRPLECLTQSRTSDAESAVLIMHRHHGIHWRHRLR